MFTLYDAQTNGSIMWSETQIDVPVADGVFSVILGGVVTLDGVEFHEPYWLGITVGAGPEFAPRVKLTSSPYSLNARSVADGAVTASKIAGGQVVKSINGKTDDVTIAEGDNVSITDSDNTLTVSAPGLWKLGGNAGTTAGTHFLGTTDDQPLELRVNGERVMHISSATDGFYTSSNIIGGYSGNTVGTGVVGATLFGGAFNGYDAYPNSVNGDLGTVSGGWDNTASGTEATVGGGWENTASGPLATVPGGHWNTAGGECSFAAG